MQLTAVIDFETTGLSPDMGDRATEIAVVMLEGDVVVDRFQSLMNAGVRIPAFVTGLTGISNAMIASAPEAEVVMADALRFVGRAPMAAHNASFDQRFWLAELSQLGAGGDAHRFACTMLLSRRLYPHAPTHQLGALARLHSIAPTGRAHRAMADAEMAAELLVQIRRDVCKRFGLSSAAHELLMKLQKTAKGALPKAVERFVAAQADRPHQVR